MDISVDGYKDVSGPLGGLSVEYVLNVTMIHPFIENSLEPSSAVTFAVCKTFGELEFLYKKLKAKYPRYNFPNLTVQNSPWFEDKEERQKLANLFMKFLASDSVLSTSEIVVKFLGCDALQLDKHDQDSRTSCSDDINDVNANKSKATNDSGVESERSIFQSDHSFSTSNAIDEVKQSDLFETTHPRPESYQSQKDYMLFKPSVADDALDEDACRPYVPKTDDVDSIIRDIELTNLKDISDLDSTSELFTIDDSLSDIYGELQEQRIKSVSKPIPKPEVLPKPALLPKPSTSPSAKPTPLPRPQSLTSRPVPPPRTAAVNRPQPSVRNSMAQKGSSSDRSPSEVPSDDSMTSSLDILSYIKTEEDVQNRNLDLFD